MSTKDDLMHEYTCGWCRQKIRTLASDELEVPCPECGYIHKDRRISDVPSETKINLSEF